MQTLTLKGLNYGYYLISEVKWKLILTPQPSTTSDQLVSQIQYPNKCEIWSQSPLLCLYYCDKDKKKFSAEYYDVTAELNLNVMISSFFLLDICVIFVIMSICILELQPKTCFFEAADLHLWPLTPWALASSSFTPTGRLWQMWWNVLQVFLRYRTPAEMDNTKNI